MSMTLSNLCFRNITGSCVQHRLEGGGQCREVNQEIIPVQVRGDKGLD